MSDTTDQLELPGISGEMGVTQLRMLARALDILRHLPVQFAVITPMGTHMQGDVELVQKKPEKARRKMKYPRGAVRQHVRQYLEGVQPGDVVRVPVGELDLSTVQSGSCNYARANWGPDSYTTARIGSEQVIEVMRVA